MKIALIGYGKMGKMIEQDAIERGHQISFIIDRNNQETISDLNLSNTDVAIEFTEPGAALNNYRTLAELKIPVVTGTTGWLKDIETVKSFVAKNNSSFLWGSNFSVGVNLLFKLNEYLASLMEKYQDYDPFIEERHHKYKKDAPSGTAITLADGILGNLSRKTKTVSSDLISRAPQEEELSLAFTRAGNIFGEHLVSYHSEIDSIQINHKAHSRRGFSRGSVIAAEWLSGRKGFFSFSDIFK